MVYTVHLSSQRIADVFNDVLDGSIADRRERFGVCLFNPHEIRLIDIIHAEYFERNNLLETLDDPREKTMRVCPNRGMLEAFTEFNNASDGKLRFSKKDTAHYPTFDRSQGAIVPYHTHPLPDQDFFSGKGGADTNFTFVENSMYIDIVVSANARNRNICPPVCVSFNPKVYRFDASILTPPGKTPDLDRAKGVSKYTHLTFFAEQFFRKFHMSIDLVVDR
jgi:hypothetical protein